MKIPIRQNGFTLIEVLVALVITAVGVAGFMALQTVSLKSNRTALQRSYATMHAYDIVDRMRVNSFAAVTGAYNLDFAETATAGSVAGDDLVAWRAAIAADLPNGQGRTAVDGVGNATIEIRWKEIADAEITKTFSTQTSL